MKVATVGKEKGDSAKSRHKTEPEIKLPNDRSTVKGGERGAVEFKPQHIFKLTKEQRLKYVRIENAALEDIRLSFRAKGLLSYLLSKSDDWTVHVNHLVTVSPDGTHSIQTALQELKKCGYARLTPFRGDKGKFGGRYWEIYERPSLQPLETGKASEKAKNRKSAKPKIGKSFATNDGLFTKHGVPTKHGKALGLSAKGIPHSRYKNSDVDDDEMEKRCWKIAEGKELDASFVDEFILQHKRDGWTIPNDVTGEAEPIQYLGNALLKFCAKLERDRTGE